MNGLELTKAIRNDATFGTLPVLMVTTRGIKEDIVQALQAKVNNYIVKPFTPAVLKERFRLCAKCKMILVSGLAMRLRFCTNCTCNNLFVFLYEPVSQRGRAWLICDAIFLLNQLMP